MMKNLFISFALLVACDSHTTKALTLNQPEQTLVLPVDECESDSDCPSGSVCSLATDGYTVCVLVEEEPPAPMPEPECRSDKDCAALGGAAMCMNGVIIEETPFCLAGVCEYVVSKVQPCASGSCDAFDAGMCKPVTSTCALEYYAGTWVSQNEVELQLTVNTVNCQATIYNPLDPSTSWSYLLGITASGEIQFSWLYEVSGASAELLSATTSELIWRERTEAFPTGSLVVLTKVN